MSSGGTTAKQPVEEEKLNQFPVGARLKAQRQKKGWALDDLAAWLRIRESYLHAFEEGDVSEFPSGAYLTGFLRSYARALGLDADDIVKEFKTVAPVADGRKSAFSLPQPMAARGMPIGLWVTAGLIVVALAYVGYYRYALKDNGLAQTVTKSPAQSVTTTDPGLSPEIAAVMPDTPIMAPSVANSHTVSHDTAKNNSSAQATSVTRRDAPTLVLQDEQAITSGQVPEPPQRDLPSEGPQNGNAHFAIVASRASWVKLVGANGKEVCNRVLKAGDSCEADETFAPYKLSTGDAGGVFLKFGEAVTGRLGEDAQRVQSLSLTKDDISNGRAPNASKLVAPSEAQTAGNGADKVRKKTSVAAKPVETERESQTEDEPNSAPRDVTPRAIAIVKRAPPPPPSESDRLNDRQLGQIRAAAMDSAAN